MNQSMRLALGAFFAFTFCTANAQKEMNFKDTIAISPAKDFIVQLIGPSINEISAKQKFDSLKLLLLNDIDQAITQNSYPANAKNTYYFVSPNGKRRLKTEAEDFTTAIDIEKEKTNLLAGLPAFQYIIYDMLLGYEYIIYTNDPQKLHLIKTLDTKEIISKTLVDKKANNKRFRVNINYENSEWKAAYYIPPSRDLLVLSPTIGVNLMSNFLSPSIGASMYVMLANKYGTPKWKIGINASTYMFSDYGGLQFKNVYAVGDFEGRLLWNTVYKTSPANPIWIGFSVGRINGYGKGDLDKAFKAGVVVQSKNIEYSFNFIKTINADKNLLYGLSVKFLF